jgi:hypothetical protein
MWRILQVGLGPLGRQVAGELCARRLGRLVGAVDPHPELVGKPLSELVPGAPEGLRVAAGLEALPDAEVALVTTSSWLSDCMPIFDPLLGRGLAVVSSCEELCWPWLRQAPLAEALAERARARGGRLLGTGVNPGFLMDALPLVATAVVRELRSLRVERVQDAACRRLPFQQKVGLGLSLEDFAERAAGGRFGHAGLEESIAFLANSLGLEVGPIESSMEPVLAERPTPSGLGSIAPGRVRGLRQRAFARTEDGRSLELRFEALAGCEAPRDGVHITGEPEIRLEIPGGVHGDVATSAILLNAIPSLLAAPPGLHTMASVPPVRWQRGAP